MAFNSTQGITEPVRKLGGKILIDELGIQVTEGKSRRLFEKLISSQ